MDLLLSYHLQSLNQMLEFSETYSRLHNLHSIGELDTDGDFLIDVGHTVSGILKRMPDWIMHLTLLTHLLHFRLNLNILCRIACHCYRINLLMRLLVPCFESWIIRSTSGRFACKELRVLCRTPLSRCSSEGPQPGTKTKGSQNLYCYTPSLSFFERVQKYHISLSCTRRQN